MKQITACEIYTKAFHNARCFDNDRRDDVIPLAFMTLSNKQKLRRIKFFNAAQYSLDARNSYSQNEAPM
jgi:hypothetical protein